MIPTGSLVSMGVSAFLGLALPVALAWWLIRRHRLRALTVLTGAAVFLLVVLVLESLVHQWVLKGAYGPAILGNTGYYALYGGLMAGLFEEGGRFLTMKFLLKGEADSPRGGVAYGIGHGGAEMMLVFGFTMLSNLVISLMVNAGHADLLLAAVPGESRAQVQEQFAQLQTLEAGSALFGLWERCSALILQLGLSMMVWTAVRKGGRRLWLLPAAIVLHALVDAGAVVLSKSVSIPLVETLVCAEALATGAIGFMLARKW